MLESHFNITQLFEQARAFMAQHDILFDGEFRETIKDEVIKFCGRDEETKKRKTEWLKCRILDQNPQKIGIVITFGSFHDTRSHASHVSKTFFLDSKPLTKEELERFEKEVKLSRVRLIEKHKKEQQQAGKLVDWCLNKLNTASDKGYSAYFERKGIHPSGVRFEKRKQHGENGEVDFEEIVLIPIRNLQGSIRAIQEIYPCERQINPSDRKPRDKNIIGKYSGCFFCFGTLENGKRILIAEGYATAASLFASTNYTTLACFSCHNFDSVISGVMIRYPESDIIICGDDDIDSSSNAGRTTAIKVASKHGCKVVFPKFPNNSKRGSDDE